MSIPTPHIEVKEKGVIAETVLMPGDPLRAKFIAENFLENAIQFNKVRNVLGYTGTYKGKKVSVMASGMGMPSMGIYSYELFKFYDVQTIMRIGSCGAYTPDLDLYDVVIVDEAWSESNFARLQSGFEGKVLNGSKELNDKIDSIKDEIGIHAVRGRIHSSDIFYSDLGGDIKKFYEETGCMAVEMEAFALFANAHSLGKNGTCILTVSDNIATGAQTTAEEREKAFTNMMKLALETAVR